jgi:hypothetical protein
MFPRLLNRLIKISDNDFAFVIFSTFEFANPRYNGNSFVS